MLIVSKRAHKFGGGGTLSLFSEGGQTLSVVEAGPNLTKDTAVRFELPYQYFLDTVTSTKYLKRVTAQYRSTHSHARVDTC